MSKRQAAMFAQDIIDTTLPQLLETLHTCSISSGQYNQICLYNEIIRGALLTGGITETKLNIYETSIIALVNDKYLQIKGWFMKAQKQDNKPVKRDGKRLSKADRKAHVEMRNSRRNAIKRLIVGVEI